MHNSLSPKGSIMIQGLHHDLCGQSQQVENGADGLGTHHAGRVGTALRLGHTGLGHSKPLFYNAKFKVSSNPRGGALDAC